MNDAQLLADDFLRLLASRGQTSYWTGHGASYALAEALTAALRCSGANAHALSTVEVAARHPLVVVTRSGRAPDLRPDLLITEFGNADAVFRVTSGQERGAWWPGDWMDACCREFAPVLGGVAEPPRLRTDTRTTILLTHHGWRALAALSDSAASKTGNQPFIASTPAEFFHGLHSRVLAMPSAFRVVTLSPAPDLVNWRDCHAQACGIIDTPLAGSMALQCLSAFRTGLSLVRDEGRPLWLTAAADRAMEAK